VKCLKPSYAERAVAAGAVDDPALAAPPGFAPTRLDVPRPESSKAPESIT
jgi:hypothetical protein